MKAVLFARTELSGFALKGGLPWGSPRKSDMVHFKEVTENLQNVVMGAGTFNSLPCKLRGRNNIVLCGEGRPPVAINGNVPDKVIYWNPVEGFDIADNLIASDSYVIIGGAELIVMAVNSRKIDYIYETIITGAWDSDKNIGTFSPPVRKVFTEYYEDCIIYHKEVI